MSDFDQKDIHKDVTADFAAEDIAPSDKMSKGQAALLGAEQGLTLGNSDEMAGGIGAGLDKTQALLSKLGLTGPSPTDVNAKLAEEGTKGDIGPKSTLDLYKEMRDEERSKIKKGQEDQPMASLAGNLAGGALLAPAAGALTPIKLGANAGLMKQIGAGAYNGAAIGGLASLGTSEATSPEQADKDIESSATGAGIIGGAIPAVGATVKGAGNMIGKSQTYQDLLSALKTGKEGLDMSSPTFLKESRDKIKELAAKADDAIRNKTGEIFGTKGKILDQLEAQGIKTDTAPVLKQFADTVGSSPALDPIEKHAIDNTLEVNFKNGFTKSPKELEKLLTDLKDLKAKVATPTGYQAVSQAIDDVKGLQNNLSPELGHLNNQAFQTIDSGAALTGSNPLDYQNSKKNMSMVEGMANNLEKGDDYKMQSKMDDILNKGLSTSKNAQVGGLSTLVPDAAAAINQASPIANSMRIAKNMQGPTFEGKNILDSSMNALSSGGTRGANAAGRAVKTSQDFLKSGVDYLSNMDKNALGGLGTKLTQVGGKVGQKFAESLQQASDANPESKNAIIFGLMQQPEFRALYHQVGQTGLDVANKLNPWSSNSGNTNNGQ